MAVTIFAIGGENLDPLEHGYRMAMLRAEAIKQWKAAFRGCMDERRSVCIVRDGRMFALIE